ncbi:Outer-arm_dynein beta [Hexamita inflata]|uniref:Outer-arm dynein beta n=1 Tax=Hexamita inflata TaxID=28002 RepID=A0AA86UZR6_9EUKA|nr:Outer-arm dynein beta [Hexamita inflata]
MTNLTSAQLEEIKKEEERVICRALRDSNYPKITKEDLPIFRGLIEDLFPGVVVDRLQDVELETNIAECTKARGLQPEPSFILKVVQLDELLPIRHSIFILGFAAVGKTAVWNVLADTKRKMKPKERLLYQVINPKAVTTRELYGYIQPSTREWKDGILSTVMRDYAAIQNNHDKWIVLDGDVDTIWIESLNTVMDDNKILTLASNERIPLLPHMRMIFEIGSLQYASPATVSRAGIIYVNESDVGWGPYYQSWVDRFEKNPLYNSEKSLRSGDQKIEYKASSVITSQLTVLASKYISPCLDWIKKGQFKTIVPTNDMVLVQSITRIIQSLLDNYVTTSAYKANCAAAVNNLQSQATNQQNQQQDYSKDVIEYYMIFACIWAVGGILCKDNGVDHKLNFSKAWKLEFSKGITFPQTTDDQISVFDYQAELEETGQPYWSLWIDKLHPYQHDPDISVKQTHVETVDSFRLHYLMQNLIQAGHPVMLAGAAGLGKSVLLKSKLNQFVEKLNYQTVGIAMNYYTTSAQLQMIMETYLVKNGKKFGPKNNRKLIYQIDDLNMSKVDEYGTQQPITFLRQQQDWRFWFDREKLQPKEIENIQFVATMNPYAGSFEINQQYQWHYTTFSIELPNTRILKQIYGNIFNAHLAKDPKFGHVRKLADPIISTLLDVHNKIVTEFPPTAIKFHYQFNLRDLTNIVDGLMKVKPEHMKSPVVLTQLLVHECDRVYMDRLVDVPDRDKYKKAVNDIIVKNLTQVNIPVGEGRPKSGAAVQMQQIAIDMAEVFPTTKLNLFTNFTIAIGDGQYAQITAQERLKQLLDEALTNHNSERAEMNLVLFQDAMEHICKISRIISTSDALLVGVGGSGKQSLAKLAAYINGYEVFEITISSNYGIDAFKEDLQKLYENAGLKGIPTMFLFTDTQIVNEEFLVFLNDILSSGNVAGLFPPEREEEITNGMRNKCKEMGLVDTDENCMKVFIQRVKENLHVVLGFSPSEQFRARCRKFPALVTCTTIDWFQPWPHEALRSVAKNFLLNRDKEKPRQFNDVEIEMDDKQIDAIALFMADCHTLVEKDVAVRYLQCERRKAYTTPKSYLELINLYLRLLYEKTQDIKSQIYKLETGNATLIKTEEEVTVLRKQLEVQKIEANKAKQEVEQLLVGLNEQTRKTNDEKQKATIKQKEAAQVEHNVKVAKAEADKKFEEAEPKLKAAMDALNSLDKKDLDELSKYANPHVNIQTLLSGVQLLISTPGQVAKDVSWKQGQSIMKNGQLFLDRLRAFDGETMNEVNKNAAQHLIEANADVFDSTEMRKKSRAAGGLCDWLKNIIEFNTVYKFVDPLKKQTEQLKLQAEEAQRSSDQARAIVDQLEGQLKVLQNQFDTANKQKDKVVQEQERMEYSLELANKLVGGLSSEKVRWKNSVIQLKIKEKTLRGDVLVTSAFISYAGPFSKKYRLDLINKWIEMALQLQIPMQENIKPLRMLADDAKIAVWNNDSLPNDEVSLENAAIFDSCQRWPLIIDPQLQGMTWIKKKEGSNLKIVRFNQQGWMKEVERALQNGSPVLVENIGETIDAVLNPILARAIIQKPGGKKAIKLGENEVEYNDNFKIYFQTKFPNPHYTPETQAQTTLINFTVTEEGLEDQLLADVVGKERADLEQKKQVLIQQQNDFKIDLQQLEKDLLDRLSKVGDNIISDTKLIATLEQTKSKSQEIEEKFKMAQITEKDIDDARNAYRPIAARASMLYFLLNSLAIIDHFYQFSLSAFKIVFFRAILNSQKSTDLLERIEILKNNITFAIYQYANRGLFERHRLIFNSQLCFNILRKENRLPAEEFAFLINGPVELGQDNPIADCVPQSSWNCVTALSRLSDFTTLVSDINGSAKRWKEWIQDEQPENQALPQEWKNKTPLQQLCIIRALRPDRLLTAMNKFIAQSISARFIEPIPFNFPDLYNEMSRSEPLFFILSPGVDPVKDVETLGLKKGFTFENGKLKSVSLGQGQERNAENGIINMAKQGGWVLLQNIHLMSKWQYKLEKMMDEYCNEQAHPDFRLYISAEPAADPAVAAVLPGIVQMCLKATNEPPTGIKANMNRAIALFTPDTFEMCQNKTNEFKQMLFCLVFFHACLLERRKFGSIGWNVLYNFTNGDLTICKDVLFNYLEANPKIPWDDLRYMFTDIFYGGHIGDDLDRRFIKVYANELFNEALFEDGKFLAPDFAAPGPLTYQEYKEYILTALPADNPKMFGLHPNAEITYLTSQSNSLFNNLILLQPAGAVIGGEQGKSKEEQVASRVETLMSQLPQEDFPISDLNDRNPEAQPFNSVCIQECTRMNILIQTMRQSLFELSLGLKGDLTMSDQMEKLMDALYLDGIPKSWEKVAYPSLKKLTLWMTDLEQRIKQLSDWSSDLSLPKCVWLSGLFNPQSFLRAVLQNTARQQKLPLDFMALQVEILKKELADMTAPQRDGAAIYGLFMDGARWDKKSSSIRDSILKDLYPPLPPVSLKAVTIDKAELKDTYECPIYMTRTRNRLTYVWSFNIKTREPSSKWVLAGVAILLANDQ